MENLMLTSASLQVLIAKSDSPMVSSAQVCVNDANSLIAKAIATNNPSWLQSAEKRLNKAAAYLGC